MSYLAFSIVAFSLCLCFYLVVLFRKHKSLSRPAVDTRFLRYIRTPNNPAVRLQSCRSNRDCASAEDQVCLHGACVFKLRGGGKCDPAAGEWTLVLRPGDEEPRAACTCKFPDLASQRLPGADCDADLSCGPVGRLETFPETRRDGGSPDFLKCVCPPDHVSRRNPFDGKPSCRPLTAFERSAAAARCGEDEVETASHPYFPENLGSIPRCVKRPCAHDALTGRPLKRARFLEGWGCVCDPRRGNVGVKLESDGPLPDDRGYDACVNIFEDGEPPRDVADVRLYTYFYVFDKRPLSFVQWSVENPLSLARPFRRVVLEKKKPFSLQVEETWPRNYTQYAFRHCKFATHLPIDVCRTDLENRRGLPGNPIADLICSEFLVTDYRMKRCKDLPLAGGTSFPEAPFVNYPVCRVEPGDAKKTTVYDGWVVTNPLYVTSKHVLPNYSEKEIRLSNGIELRPFEGDGETWYLDLAPSKPDYVGGIPRPDLVPDLDSLMET